MADRTPEELVAAVQRAVERTEEIARWAAEGPWVWVPGSLFQERPDGLIIIPSDELGDGIVKADDLRHIAHNDPARVLRCAAADRRVLARHSPRQIPTAPVGYVVCDWCDQGPPPARHVRWPGECRDFRDLADRYGITVEKSADAG